MRNFDKVIEDNVEQLLKNGFFNQLVNITKYYYVSGWTAGNDYTWEIFTSTRLKLIHYLKHSTTQAQKVLEAKNKYLEIKTRHKGMHSSITAFNSPHAFRTRLSSLNPGPEALFAEVAFMGPRVAHT